MWENPEFEVCLGYIQRPCLKNKSKLGAVAHTYNPKLLQRLRLGGLRFEASPGKKSSSGLEVWLKCQSI
jgi:hypothetical protein